MSIMSTSRFAGALLQKNEEQEAGASGDERAAMSERGSGRVGPCSLFSFT